MLTKEQVQTSIQAKWRLYQMRLYLVLLGVSIALSFFISLFSLAAHELSSENMATALFAFGVMALIFLLVFVPFALFYLYQYRILFRGLEAYTVYTVTLDRPSTSYWYRGAVFYTIRVENRDIETLPLWSSGSLAKFPLEAYNNKTVKVAYSATLEKLIVLG